MNIEELLEQPYYIMDVLPMQVPAEGGGQYFRVEQYFLNDIGRLGQKYADVLLKLNCYYDLAFSHDAEIWLSNPDPEMIVQMVNACMALKPVESCLYVSLADGNTLLVLQRDATHMTLFNPTTEHLQLLRQLASAVGLFVWKSNNNFA